MSSTALAVRIDTIKVMAYTIPTNTPEADGTLAWDSTTVVLVEVRSGAVCGTGWTYGPPACAQVITDQLADVVLGRDALDVGAAFEGMVKAVRNAGRPGAVGYAISAVDVALWNLSGPLPSWISGGSRNQSLRMIWMACVRSGTPSRRMSPPVSTAMT
jgi:L-alanine-DL-glutamate epimerase-like enolase superfamily enzyme